MFVPYKVDVPFNHRPVVNWLVSVAVIVVFGLQVAEQIEFEEQMEEELAKQVEKHIADGDSAEEAIEHVRESVGESIFEKTMYRFALRGWGIKGLLGHMWLHADIFHLIGNLIFLWLFGNAVCSKIGNIFYLPVYVVLGLAAAVVHLIFVGGPMLGASGAINGIVGMYLVLFPENSISCFVWLFFRPITFSVSGYWMILLWFAFDVWGAMKGGGGVAYFAHIGGFAAGFGLAILMLKMKWLVMERDEKSLLQMLGWDKKQTQPEYGGQFAYQQQQWKKSVAETAQSRTATLEPEKPQEQLIRFVCQCGKKIKVPAKYAGKTGSCPRCKKQLRIPNKPSI